MARYVGQAIAEAFPQCTVDIVDDTSRPPEHCDDIEILVAYRFPPGMLGAMPRLRWLQLTSVGSDQVAAGRPRSGLTVTHAGSVPAEAVAEFVWMALLAFAKEAPTLLRQQQQRIYELPRLPDARRDHDGAFGARSCRACRCETSRGYGRARGGGDPVRPPVGAGRSLSPHE